MQPRECATATDKLDAMSSAVVNGHQMNFFMQVPQELIATNEHAGSA